MNSNIGPNELIRIKILHAMEKHNIKEKDFATILELPTNKAQELLNGNKDFSTVDLTLFCNSLGISLESLFE